MDNFEQKYNMTFNEDEPVGEEELEYKYENVNKNNVYIFLAEIENQISQKLIKTSSMHTLRPKKEIIIKSPKSKSTKNIKRIEKIKFNY